MKTLFSILIILFFLLSCTPVSKEIMGQVDQTLTFGDVQRSPRQYNGKIVLWGGVIVEMINRQDETRIVVMQTALDFEKRPVNLDRSEGRFLVRHPGFLDPTIYDKGRQVTVAGEIVGREDLALGDVLYSYPVLLAKEIHLWEKRKDYPPYYYDPWFWGPYPYGWYPYWHRPPGWW
jgi:outer membrane lipoprotein